MNPLPEPVTGPSSPQTVRGPNTINDSRSNDTAGRPGTQRKRRKPQASEPAPESPAPAKQADDGHVDVLA